jgi:hypothetical protein
MSPPAGTASHRSQDQSEVEAFLAGAAAHGAGPVERIETHCAVVFLAGDFVHKMKKAVSYAFLDFSTLAKRKAAIVHELERGRAIAPGIYLDVVPVTREPSGALALGGTGTPVEWTLRMHRFAQDRLLSAVAEAGGLTDALARELGFRIAAMHADAAPRPGGRDDVAAVIERTILPTLREQPETFAPARVEAMAGAFAGSLAEVGALLDARGRTGLVRLVHGDLHLSNIVLLDGRPTPFDAIEFDDRIATSDVAYDLAFLLMDLWQRGHRRAANLVLSRYLERSGDLAGLALLPLFMAMRAAIRGMIAGMRGRTEVAGGYFAWAERFLAPAPPRLVAVGGLSGTGKTTLALALAPYIGRPPGAVVLRADVIRKGLFGVGETDQLPVEAYRPEASARVYRAIAARAAEALAAGHGALADAVHAGAEERAAIAKVAGAAGVRFSGLWLAAPEATLLQRVAGRSGDASDADATVVRRQLGYDLGEIAWDRLDASGGAKAVLGAALARLEIDPDQAEGT